MIAGARKRGVDVPTELYPYEAASTGIQAAIFDPGWQERLGIREDAFRFVKTGERASRPRRSRSIAEWVGRSWST